MSDHESAAVFSRIRTGSVQADEVLDGGFPANSINIVMGEPGTGKTIFVEQLMFHNAGGDRPVLYLTTLSEPLAKVIRYLQRFEFFDEREIGTTVLYDDLGVELADQGVGALMPRMKDVIKTRRPKIVVIDSFKAVHDLAASAPEMRRLVFDLAGLLSAYETTAFLVGEYAMEHVPVYPEFAVADGIVELLRRGFGTRDERYLRVLKLRGSGYREGLHAISITGAGLEVYPRLVTPDTPERYESVFERVPTGVDGLDAMLDGGLWRGTTTLVAGPTGSGKTTLGLQFLLEGVRQGEPGLFLNFQENPTQVARLLRSQGVDPEEVRRQGLHLLYTSPVELQIDSIIVTVFRLIQELGIRRVVVDAVGDLAVAATDTERLHDYLYALIQHLAVNGITGVFTFETHQIDLTGQGGFQTRFSYMSDNIVLLEFEVDGRTRRTLRIIKTRGSAHDPRVREVEIDARGIHVR